MLSVVLFAVLFLDVISKFWAQNELPLIAFTSHVYPYGGVGIFKNFYGIEFSLVHATNKGAAWGIFSSYPTSLLILRIVLIAGLAFYYFKQNSLYLKLSIALILAGAIGNVLDIFFYGHVIDLFHFIFWGYAYPVFNVADSAICIGVFLYLLFSWNVSHDSQATIK